MCGICGSNGPGAGHRVALMNALQRHRGPDHAAVATAAGLVVGNTRLAIVDLSESGNQPLASQDGSVLCVFNGEIYNHRELIRDHGLATTGGSDGAVIPALYQRYGTRGLSMLRGMFGLAVVDLTRRRVVLARDPLGIKPLHWCRTPAGEVLFASEPRALAAAAGAPTPSPEALADVLSHGHVTAQHSPFAGIESIGPNEWLELDGDRATARGTVRADLWHGDPVGADELRDALLDTVHAHLRSDVPTALLLSSGIDSAAVAWAASRAAAPLTCFTVDIGGGQSEGAIAAEVARQYGHRHIVVSRDLQSEDVAAFIHAMQRPSIDGLNTYLVCRAVAEQGVRVALSGLGGDEATAGYSHFRILPFLRALGWADRAPRVLHEAAVAMLPRWGAFAGKKVRELLGPDGPRDAPGLSGLQRRLFTPAEVSALTGGVGGAVARRGSADRTALDLSLAEIRGYLQGMLLPDADAYSMASSVELRVPLVDVEFLRVALNVDPARGLGKRRFARWSQAPLLRACAARPKRGFSVPMDRWMRCGPLAPLVDQLDDPAAQLWQQLDQAVGRTVLARWRRGGRWSEAWALAALNAWLTDVSSARHPAAPVGGGAGACAE